MDLRYGVTPGFILVFLCGPILLFTLIGSLIYLFYCLMKKQDSKKALIYFIIVFLGFVIFAVCSFLIFWLSGYS